MMQSKRMAEAFSRRRFLITVGTAAGGLVIGVPFGPARAAAALAAPWTQAHPADAAEVGAWLVIARDDTVTIRVAQAEMGEGIFTALPMIVAEELECDWAKVRAEYASVNRSLRENNIYGRMSTGGSSAVRLGRVALQQAGASARIRLIEAAARQWGVAPGECTAREGKVEHRASGRSLGYGALAEAAGKIRLDAEPAIKTPEQYRLIGKPVSRLDTPEKVDGTAVFGLDVRVPDMLYAAVKTCPVFGGSLKSFEFTAIKDRPGVHSAHPIPNGIAVVADSTWRAKAALEALPVTWDEGPNAAANSAAHRALFRAAVDSPGAVARNDGDAAKALAAAGGKRVDAVYEVPHLAHATMEPLNCTAHVQADRVDIWVGTQVPEAVVALAADLTGVKPANIFLNNCFLGGGFGRRLVPDEIRQALLVAKAVGRPVKLVWSREEDMTHDRYRPQAAIRFEALLGSDGMPTSWRTGTGVGSIARSLGRDKVASGVDRSALEGLENMRYSVPNILVECALRDTPVPLGAWRSVNSSQNGFALESFIDELAVAAGKDPYQFRRALLAGHADWLKVLDTAAEKAGWGGKLERGRGRGIAVFECFGTVCAEIAEVTVSRKGELKVDRVVAAVDCGHVVNPRIVESQIESAIAFGLSAALYGEITLAEGRVEQSNFDAYEMVRMADMPKVDVHLALSGGTKWGGIGEPGTPPIAPAVTNAIHAATGKRIRALPLKRQDLSWT